MRKCDDFLYRFEKLQIYFRKDNHKQFPSSFKIVQILLSTANRKQIIKHWKNSFYCWRRWILKSVLNEALSIAINMNENLSNWSKVGTKREIPFLIQKILLQLKTLLLLVLFQLHKFASAWQLERRKNMWNENWCH